MIFGPSFLTFKDTHRCFCAPVEIPASQLCTSQIKTEEGSLDKGWNPWWTFKQVHLSLFLLFGCCCCYCLVLLRSRVTPSPLQLFSAVVSGSVVSVSVLPADVSAPAAAPAAAAVVLLRVIPLQLFFAPAAVGADAAAAAASGCCCRGPVGGWMMLWSLAFNLDRIRRQGL